MEATATLRYLKASPQKVRLVADLIRGRKVDEALSILRFTKKTSAKDLEKLLRSAVANAENSEAGVDTDDLVVSKIYVNEGPREKRIQPAPMGRAYRIQKRKAHVTVHVSDEVKAVNARGGARPSGSPASGARPSGASASGAPASGAPASAGKAAKKTKKRPAKAGVSTAK
ncbi:MAG TPA: 50S ribosomal protein L22 [Thermoanaerobaculia bacterium]|nr:50S ribosomal protein L22 [Thermoanaerobaculia bacterium]